MTATLLKMSDDFPLPAHEDLRLHALDQGMAMAATLEEAFGALADYARADGFDDLLCRCERAAGPSPLLGEFATLSGPVAALMADAEFRAAWPIEAAARNSDLPFAWTRDVCPGVTHISDTAAMYRLARSGAEAGLACLVRGPRTRTLAVAFCSRDRAGDLSEADRNGWLVAMARFNARAAELAGRISPSEQLSRRELEVLRLSGEGLTARVAARRLGVSEATVKFHLTTARKKLNVKNTAEAIAQLNNPKAVPRNPHLRT